MNILVTGSNGQLGNELRVLSPQFPQFQYFFTDVEELDICKANAVMRYVSKNEIRCIINCAAYTAVDRAEEEPKLAYAINAFAVDHLCAAAKKHSAFLVHISTDYVFDGSKILPYDEQDAAYPISVYGKSKLQGEELIRASGIPSLIFRTSWLYSSFGSNFVKTMLRLSKERSELNIVTDQVGAPTYAADLAWTILEILSKHPLPTIPEIYHYSNLGKTTWYEFAQEIIQLSGGTTKLNPITTKDYPTPAARPKNSMLCKAKLLQDFGIRPPQWYESLKVCMKILKEKK